MYHQYRTIDETLWGKGDIYSFTFQVNDTITLYDIALKVRSDNLYPYQNLWVFCSEMQPFAPSRLDTLECMLADDFGKWYGKGIVLHQLSFPIRTGYRFPIKGQYTFSFRQAMRNDSLRGIREIGLFVQRATQGTSHK
jgi:gliding motility-associated lipoprotein GldH